MEGLMIWAGVVIAVIVTGLLVAAAIMNLVIPVVARLSRIG
jgi:hypothetical protein